MSVAEFADFQARQEAESTEARESWKDILSSIEDLDDVGIEPFAQPTIDLVQALSEANEFDIQIARERYCRAVKGHISAPSRLFDAARSTVSSPSAIFESFPGQGRRVSFEMPEPHPEPVSGVDLLNDLEQLFLQHVILAPGAARILALWVLHTYIFDAFWVTPRLAITSPEKRCGKTLVLMLLKRLVARPLMCANASPAAIFRSIERYRPTLLIDEGDTFLDRAQELQGILNSGHSQDGHVLRTVGEDHEARSFSTFSPLAIAMIGDLYDTLADRSIPVRMERKRPMDTVAPLRLDRLDHLNVIRSRALRWARDHRADVEGREPDVPAELNDRAADNWRGLLAIADSVGGHWPEWARALAVEAAQRSEDDTSAGVQLLIDIHALFVQIGKDALFSAEIISSLAKREDRRWPEWDGGQSITPRQVAKLLQPFGIKPRQIRRGSRTRKGYRRDDFREAFERYLPLQEPKHPKHPKQVNEINDLGSPRIRNTGSGVSEDRSAESPCSSRVVSDVSDVSDQGTATPASTSGEDREVFEI
ncbi:MAG: DUF3631 domain-containing protein [Acidobacteriota bacterium]